MATITSILNRDQVCYTQGSEDSAGRCTGTIKASDGSQVNVLLEWRASVPKDIIGRVAEAIENLPTHEDVNRPEEVRTFKLHGISKAKRANFSAIVAPTALVYECPHKPLTLKELLLTVAKPSGDDRCRLAGIVARQIRSLHVHFRVRHAGLRTESFVFLRLTKDPTRPDLSTPFLLDWGRPSIPSMYEHPDYKAGQSHWFYDVWSLMIILSEIAEWKPIEATFLDANELLQKKLERRKLVMNSSWKGDGTAKVMQYGFKFLLEDHFVLENLSWKEIKRFFDGLCSLLEG
jgi:hypothetical protein